MYGKTNKHVKHNNVWCKWQPVVYRSENISVLWVNTNFCW